MTTDQNLVKHKVLFSEYSTGHVFTTGLKLFVGQGDIYNYFDTYDGAVEFSNNVLLTRPDLEYTVFAPNGEMIFFKNIHEEKHYSKWHILTLDDFNFIKFLEKSRQLFNSQETPAANNA